MYIKYIFIYIRIRIYIYFYLYIYICIYTYTYIYLYMHTCTYDTKLFTSYGLLGDPPTFLDISVIWRADFTRQRRANCWSRCLCCAARHRGELLSAALFVVETSRISCFDFTSFCGEHRNFIAILSGSNPLFLVGNSWILMCSCPTDRPLRGGSDKLFRLMRNWSTWRPILSSFNGRAFQQKTD